MRAQGDHVLLLLLLELLVLVHMALQLQDSCLVAAGCLLQAATIQAQANHSATRWNTAAVVVVCIINHAAVEVSSRKSGLLKGPTITASAGKTGHACW